jgi:predicted RND superfamily exporter protein
MIARRTVVERLVDWQLRRPVSALLAVAVVTMVFAVLASRLTLRTRYDALLPDDAPSVQELRRLEQRAAASQTVLVVLEGPDRAALRGLGDALVPALLALGPDEVTSAESGPHDARAFLTPRLGLFLARDELERLDRETDERWDYEVARASGLLLDDAAPPPLAWGDIEKRLRAALRSDGGGVDLDRFPDGYYERGDGRALVVIARSPIAGGDLARVGRALGHIRATVEHVRSSAPQYANVAVSYAGDMPTGFREYAIVSHDLLSVGAGGIALVLAAVILYFLRLRSILVMAVTIAVGLTWTFGLTAVVIGHLNVATAFLVSIVAGNGINVGILYQSRYFEERRRGLAPEAAVRAAVHATWKPTAIAALAAGASYGSLLITDFRAFRDFGFIAAAGMVLCWIVKTLMVPPMLVLIDRGPAVVTSGWLRRHEMAYGRPFAWLVSRAPALFMGAGVLVAIVGITSAARFVQRDPMEYDLRKTETDRSQTSDLHHAWAVARDVLGSTQGAVVIATDSTADGRALETTLRDRWRAASPGSKPFVAVHGLSDFVAPDQSDKISLLTSIGERIERAHARGFLEGEEWTRVREFLPPDDLRSYTEFDVPAQVADRFTDANGVRGALVLVESDPNTANDLRSLVRYADALRETRLPDGKTVRGSGNAVILADMLRAVVRDVPRAITLSLGLTLFMVLLAFRKGPYLAGVLFALAVGAGGVACFLYFANIKLNFLNFSALPITFGIGVDYAVNVAQRYEADRRSSILEVLRTSGGAVVLCSLTTMLGYLALLGSHNAAIRGLGAIAAVGEVSCLLAAVLVMPSLWRLVERNPQIGGLYWALQPFRPRHRPMP